MAPVGMDDDQMEVVRREAEGPRFRSEAARWEYERLRRQRVVVRVTLGLLILIGWSYGLYRFARRGSESHPDSAEHSGCSSASGIAAVGSSSAKVRVQCILPSGSDCHASIVKFLTDTAEKRPDQVRVDFDAMEGYSEKDLTAKIGSFCAGVLINSKAEFDLVLDGKPSRVSLIGTAPTHYSLYEVGEALQSVYVQVYGPSDEKVYALPEGEKREAVSALSQGEKEPEAGDSAVDINVKLQGTEEIELRE